MDIYSENQYQYGGLNKLQIWQFKYLAMASTINNSLLNRPVDAQIYINNILYIMYFVYHIYIYCALVDLYTKLYKMHCKRSSPVTGLEWPRGFQEVKVPKFHDNGTGRW
jgi:hypothetical protein